jgi:lysophospholipase L1-like esterase
MKYSTIYKPVVTALVAGIAVSCTPTIDEPTLSGGQASFTKYVAIGNSLTAGYADGGVYREGQLNSYPNLLAQQFKKVGGGDFIQPLYTEAGANGTGYLKMTGFNAQGRPVLASVTTGLGVVGVQQTATGITPLYQKFTGANQNLGVPGIRVSAIGFNPNYERLLADGATTAYLDYVKAQLAGATFYTCWLGNNDALGYATTGGVTPLTTQALFTTNYTQLVTALKAVAGAKGVVANVPNVTAVPFLNTVTFAAVSPQLALARAGVKDGLRRGLPAAISGNAQLMGIVEAEVDKVMDSMYIALPDGRPIGARSSDLFILTATDSLGSTKVTSFLPMPAGFPIPAIPITFPKGFSRLNPLNHPLVLDRFEIIRANTAVAGYNATIAQIAAANNIPVLNVNAIFDEIRAKGRNINGVVLSASYVSGGLFSLDGVHPTPRGYAVITNEFINLINRTYGATVPTVDPLSYNGVMIKP